MQITWVNSLCLPVHSIFPQERFNKEICKTIERTFKVFLLNIKTEDSLENREKKTTKQENILARHFLTRFKSVKLTFEFLILQEHKYMRSLMMFVLRICKEKEIDGR